MEVGFLLLLSAGGAVVLASLRLWLKSRRDVRRLEALLASSMAAVSRDPAPDRSSTMSVPPMAQDGVAALIREIGVKADLVVGFANVLLAAPPTDAVAQRRRQALGEIRRAGDDIRHAVGQALAGPETPRPLSIVSLDPHEAVRVACAAAVELGAERNVVIRHPTPQPGLCLMGDASTLSRALGLLISEAVRLSRADGGVLIAFRRIAAEPGGTGSEDAFIAIDIRDTREPGRAFSEAEGEAQNLLALMGGQLQRSVEADGAVQTLLLRAAAAGRAWPEPAAPLPKAALLHVDPHPARAALMRQAVQVLGGAEVYTCASLDEAAGLAVDLGPDVILIDESVCSDGAAAIAARFGRVEATRAAAWVLVGSRVDRKTSQTMQAFGFSACLDHPLDIGALEQVLRRLLDVRMRPGEGVAARARRLGMDAGRDVMTVSDPNMARRGG